MKTIEITNFELSYDGMYFIKWDNHQFRVFLALNTILKMLEIEGLSFDDVNNFVKSWKPIKFKKVTMFATGYEQDGKLTLLTSEFSDEYIDTRSLTMIEIELKSDNE